MGYDRHVIYTERRPSPIPYIDVSDYDSDVILVSDTNSQTQNSTNPVIIDLVDTDSDEPIIVSEERNGSSGGPVQVLEDDEEQNRKPILPLKLRLKDRHKSKDRRNGGGRKRCR